MHSNFSGALLAFPIHNIQRMFHQTIVELGKHRACRQGHRDGPLANAVDQPRKSVRLHSNMTLSRGIHFSSHVSHTGTNGSQKDGKPHSIRLATLADLDALVDLANRYYIGNMKPSQRAEGFISNLITQQWFQLAIKNHGLHVAILNNAVVGFIGMTAPPPRETPGLSPIIASMLDLVNKLEFNGKPIASQRYAFRGPVCIDEHARGCGIYNEFNAVVAKEYQGRFDMGVLFVAAENPRSLHTTTTKLGATSLAIFEVENRSYHFLAFNFQPGLATTTGTKVT
jgi:hypothetical protein